MSDELFKVHPFVVIQLGEALIGDRITALLELVKNAYDADSPDANVSIDPYMTMESESTFFPNAKGKIVIEDSGCGMDWTVIKRGWLTLSDSPKREQKAQGKLNPGTNRTPLGDKGLGRLSAMGLGRNLEIFTCADRDQTGYHVGINWDSFRTAASFADVTIYIEEIPKRKGTRLVISDLNEPDRWLDQRALVQRQLSQVFFPFGKARPFVVRFFFEGERLDLAEVIARIRDTATIRYSFEFDRHVLRITGRYRLNYLESQENREEFKKYIEPDSGASAFAYMRGKLPGAVTFLDNQPGWFVTTEAPRVFRELAGLREANGALANPGPFSGELDYFELTANRLEDVFNDRGEFRKFVKEHSGIRVYRDGFAIRPYGFEGNDWLGFSKEATGGRSSYSLRVQNTVGFVNITAAENSQLAEITSREGFQDTPYFLNFMRLMSEVVRYINTVNMLLRRGANEFLGSRREQQQAATPSQRIREIAAESRVIEQSMGAVRTTVQNLVQKVSEGISPTGNSPPGSDPDRSKQWGAIQEARETLEAQLIQIEAYLQRLRTLARDADRVEANLKFMQERVEDYTELASLGLVAEAFSHELKNVANGLHERTKKLVQHLQASPARDPAVVAYVKTVRQVIVAMRKQLTHLSPSLRYVRDQKETIDLRQFLREHREFHQPTLRDSGISYQLDDGVSFYVTINRGKLIQVFDNVVLNSEYWLQQAAVKRLGPLEIHVVIKPPYVQIWDTGMGVDPLVDDTLFEPFVTTKPKGEGRGLGLYIVRQLLESDGCRISLLPYQNSHGRRYIFQLDLSGACQ